MPITRRKSQIYPVALAISLLIASKAKAQLCPTASESKSLPGFAEPASFAAPAEKTTGQIRINAVATPSQPSQPAIATTANFGPALAQPALVEVSSRNSGPQAVDAWSELSASSPRQTDLVRKLMVATSQPMLAEVSFQSLFVE